MSLTNFTKKQLYIEAKATKKADCPRISKYNKQELIDYLGEGRIRNITNNVVKKLKVSKYLKDKLKEFNDATNKQQRDTIKEKVLDDSGDTWFEYRDTSDGNKTRALSSIAKTKKLSDDDMITLFLVMSLLKVPKAKKTNFIKVGKSRGIFNFIRTFIPAPQNPRLV